MSDKEKILFLVRLGGGSEAEADPSHPSHHECIQQAVNNAFILLEYAQAYESELDTARFEAIWGKL